MYQPSGERPNRPTESSTSQGPLPQTSAATLDFLLVDFTQGLATGTTFYLAALMMTRSLAPPNLVLMMILSSGALFWGLYRMAWREATLALGITIGLAANLFTPVLFFMLYFLGWFRVARLSTLPWIAVGLSLFAVGAGLAMPTIAANVAAPQSAVLSFYYLIPVTFGSLGCAMQSQFLVAVARQESVERSLKLIGPQWLTVLAVMLSMVGLGLMAIQFAVPA